MSDQNYFTTTVLPSTKMPVKENYSLAEASVILAVKEETVKTYDRNFRNKRARIRLRIEPDNTILYSTFQKFFQD